MARTNDARKVKSLKENRKTGLREIKKFSRGFSTENIVGNLIRTDAQVSNAMTHVNYASSDSTPYFISTFSRYQALIPNKTRIMESTVASYGTPKDSPLSKLAEQIKDDETKGIERTFSPIWPSRDADWIVNHLNSLEVEINEVKRNISDIVGETSRAIQDAFFEFKISNDTARAEIYELITLARTDPAAFASAPTMMDQLQNSVGYRNKDKDIAGNLQDAIEVFSTIFNEVEIGVKSQKTFNKAFSSMIIPLTMSQKQSGFGQGVKAKKFIPLMTELNKIIDLAESKLDGDAKKLKLDKGWFTSGNFAEALGAGIFVKALQQELGQEPDNKKETLKHNEEVKKQFLKITADIVADNPVDNKTIDMIYTVGKNKVGIDSKRHSKAKHEKYGGMVYESSMTMDFHKAGKSLMNNSNSSLPTSVLKLYRAYLLNVGINDGYTIHSNKEKAMYIQEFLKTKEGMDYKFDSKTMGYPYLVVINGTYLRFSDIIMKMKNTDDFIGELTGPVQVATPKSISSYGFKPQQLYMDKIRAGAVSSVSTGKSQSRRTAGFADQVPGMRSLAESVEDTYFSSHRAEKVNFKILLRK